MMKLKVLLLILGLSLFSTVLSADRSMQKFSKVGNNGKVDLYWKYIEGLGVKVVKLKLVNLMNSKIRFKADFKVYNGGSVIKSWEVDQTIKAKGKVGSWNGFDMEKQLNTYADSIRYDNATIQILKK